jgi:ribosomal-protein-alanine N-acetyltransferase
MGNPDGCNNEALKKLSGVFLIIRQPVYTEVLGRGVIEVHRWYDIDIIIVKGVEKCFRF